MELFGIAYTSQATRSMGANDLDRLLIPARSNNSLMGVTGVLLYGEGRFFQYFEGSREGVDDVYARVLKSSLHENVVELENQRIAERQFNRWFMGFRETPGSVLQKLYHEQWARELPWFGDQQLLSPGMRHLTELVVAKAD